MSIEKYLFKVKLSKDPNSTLLWNFRVYVPEAISNSLIDENRRVLCSINSEPHFHAALMPDRVNGFFIMINKDLRKKLGINEGDELTVCIEKDRSEYGMFVPEAFKELKYQDPEGSTLFHQLSMGKQRTLLHLMAKPKSESKQIEKTLIIFDYLKSVQGNLDFKELNEAFKNSRFKQ